MEVLDQVKERVEQLVEDVKLNTTEVQGKTQETLEMMKENYNTAIATVREEFANSSTTLKGYQERLSTKFNKHFNGEELVADIKEEVDFFSNELKDSVGRIKEAFNK